MHPEKEDRLMICQKCGAEVAENGRFCPQCGSAVEKGITPPAPGEVSAGERGTSEVRKENPGRDAENRADSAGTPQKAAPASGSQQPPAGQAAAVQPVYVYVPYAAAVSPQGIPAETGSNASKKNRKGKKPKKQSSGCLMSFLISMAVFLVLGLILAYVIGKLLPGGKGNAGDKQIQPEVQEAVETSDLQRELGGTYTPDEKDFRFDDSDSVSGYVDHVILVYFRKGVSDEEVRRVASLVDGDLIGCISGLNLFEIRVPVSGSEALRQLCSTLSDEESVDWATLDRVSRVTSSWSDPGLGDFVPNDPWGEWTWIPQGLRNLFLQQWSMIWPRGNNWHQEIIGAPSAWAYEEYYSRVSVGIIDGGFDTDHPDLRITVVNPDANRQTLQDAEMKDNYDHGTHVAGIIGATRGNGTGVNGILCGEYSLFGYCVNHGSEDTEVASVKMDGCDRLLRQGCRVINRSMGLRWRYWDKNNVWHDCINENNRPFDENDNNREITDEEWRDHGILAANEVLTLLINYGNDFLLVNSAGNDSIDALYNGWICSVTRETAEAAVRERGPDCPYTAQDVLDAIMIVGSVDNNKDYGEFTFIRDGVPLIPADCERSLVLSDFSNFGSQVTIAAPGNEVYSTVDHRGWSSDYNEMGGTSMASPVLAACAAQVWSIDLDMSPGEVKQCLLSTAIEGVNKGSEKDTTNASYEMVNLKDAVERLLLQKGRITWTRPDGDLKRIAQIISYNKLEEGQEEIEKLFTRYENELTAGEYKAAMGTFVEVVKKASEYQVYGFFYILAELL